MIHNYNNKIQYLNKNDIVLLSPEDIHCFYENAPHNHLHILISEKLFSETTKSYGFNIKDFLNAKQKQQIYSLDNEQTDNIENIVHALQTICSKGQLQTELTKILFRTVLDYYFFHYTMKKFSYNKFSYSFSKLYNLIIKKENISKSIKETRILCGYSQSQFYWIFMKYTGQSPVNYINNIKLNHAAHLLNTTDMKIINIAQETGYNSISNFNTKFKQYYGVTPSRYRKDKPRY